MLRSIRVRIWYRLPAMPSDIVYYVVCAGSTSASVFVNYSVPARYQRLLSAQYAAVWKVRVLYTHSCLMKEHRRVTVRCVWGGGGGWLSKHPRP